MADENRNFDDRDAFELDRQKRVARARAEAERTRKRVRERTRALGAKALDLASVEAGTQLALSEALRDALVLLAQAGEKYRQAVAVDAEEWVAPPEPPPPPPPPAPLPEEAPAAPGVARLPEPVVSPPATPRYEARPQPREKRAPETVSGRLAAYIEEDSRRIPCPRCGATVRATSAFCPKCHLKLPK